MAAIRILQERLNKPKVITIIQAPSPPPDSTIIKRDSPIIKRDTLVYAVWFDDDGLVYKVC